MGVAGGGVEQREAAEAGVDRGRQRGRVADRRHAADGEAGRPADAFGIAARGTGPLRPSAAGRAARSQRRSPATRARTGAPSIANTSDLTMAPTGTPQARAASSAVRAVAASSTIRSRAHGAAGGPHPLHRGLVEQGAHVRQGIAWPNLGTS